MKQPARYYLFPREAYFVPSVRRLVGLLEVMDREMDLGFPTGGSFQGFVRVRAPEETTRVEDPSAQILDVTSFEDFRTRSDEVSGETKEIQVHLGRPGREPILSHDLGTKNVDVLGFPSLRMVDVGDVEQARLLCPSCGGRSHFDASFSVRPDPRFYCGQCGALTPLPDTRFAMGETDEGIPFPCYRLVILFDAEAEAIDQAVLAPAPEVVGIEALESALGCGLRAILVRSPGQANA